MTRIRTLLALAGVALAVGLVMVFQAPVDALQGEFSRILPIHVSTSWLAFLAFGVTALASVMWRFKKTPEWDRRAAASAEIGVLFNVLCIATGALWGGAVWGVYWDWADPRMATTALMLFVYIAYLALRAASPDRQTAASRSSLLGIIAVVQIPLVYFSVNMFRSLHQTQSIRPDGATMPSGMLIAMLVNLGAFTLAYVALMSARTHLFRRDEERQALAPAAADSVRAPRFDEVPDV